jgi:hypothetical protein
VTTSSFENSWKSALKERRYNIRETYGTTSNPHSLTFQIGCLVKNEIHNAARITAERFEKDKFQLSLAWTKAGRSRAIRYLLREVDKRAKSAGVRAEGRGDETKSRAKGFKP